VTHAHTPSRPAKKTSLYERDLYAWVQEQVRLLRAGSLHEIDAENIAEEILDVGRNEYDKLESALRVLLAHMLKWDHQPTLRTRSWENTIKVQRHHALRQLEDNPSLKSRRNKAVKEGYYAARLLASSETDMDVDRFAEECPYDWEAIVGREFKR
jgi:Domain of unknown function DUF29